MRLNGFVSIAREMLLPTLAALVVVALPSLAYSDPIDPTWNSGIWDDDDFDNVVLAITHTLVVADPGPAIVLRFDAASFPVCLPVERCALTLCPLDWFEGRAPPVA